MRSAPLLLVALLVAAPLATATLPTTPVTAPPKAHATLDLTAYRAQVDKAVQFALSNQKADGGIYQYSFILQGTEASRALVLLANDQRTAVRGPAFAALVDYWEKRQNVDGSFGSGCCVPTYTAAVLDGLLDAGYDADAPAVQRGLAFIRLTQSPTGGWSDGGSVSSHQTAWNVELLLRTGTPRDDPRVQRAVQFILGTRHADTGGFGPTAGWFETEAVTAHVVGAFEAYLRAPAGPNELVPQATVEDALQGALAFLAARIDPQTGWWQHSVGANAEIVGPVARHYAHRGLAMPAWLLQGAQALVDHQAPNGGLYNNQKSAVIHDWTYSAYAGLLEFPRALGSSGTLPVQARVNHQGDWQDAAVTVTLVDANGAARATATGPDGALTLAWTGLPAGRYVVRTEAAGAAPHETPVWR
ncbi:MAG TPA: prenyltransferase/squalene oxidase repeat-containing protein [Candidatus Thermoplasmatota archaeon]|nr:prenyltransferase/squalene oxidase repeat-containing protein [Candidatus Thermoplasmatota archaeon]